MNQTTEYQLRRWENINGVGELVDSHPQITALKRLETLIEEIERKETDHVLVKLWQELLDTKPVANPTDLTRWEHALRFCAEAAKKYSHELRYQPFPLEEFRDIECQARRAIRGVVRCVFSQPWAILHPTYPNQVVSTCAKKVSSLRDITVPEASWLARALLKFAFPSGVVGDKWCLFSTAPLSANSALLVLAKPIQTGTVRFVRTGQDFSGVSEWQRFEKWNDAERAKMVIYDEPHTPQLITKPSDEYPIRI